MDIKLTRQICVCARLVLAATLMVAMRTAVAQTPQAVAPPAGGTSAKPIPATGALIVTVTDSSGAPVAAINITVACAQVIKDANAAVDARVRFRRYSLATDGAGSCTLRDVVLDKQVVASAQSQEYRYVSGGDVTRAADGLHVALRVVKLSAQITGRVVDGKGKPVPGADVWSPEGGMAASAITDTSGLFTLRHLPAGRVKLDITRGTLLSEQNAEAVALPDARNVAASNRPRAKLVTFLPGAAASTASTGDTNVPSLLPRMIESKNGEGRVDRSDLVNYLARTDLEAALRLAGTIHKQGEALPDGVIANFIEARLKTNPQLTAAWAKPHVEQMGQAMTRIRCNCEIGIALSYSDLAAAGKWYDACRADSEQPNAAVDLNRARLVALAALLGKKTDEAEHLKRLTTVLTAMPDGDYSRVRCAEQVARGDIGAAETLLDKATPGEKVEFYIEIVHQCLRYSPSLCGVAIAKLQLALAPLATNVNPSGIRDQVAELVLSVIPVLGPADPKGALALARSIPESDRNFPVALAAAARFQREAVAVPLWAEASAKAQANLDGSGDTQYYATDELVDIASEAAKGPSPAAKSRAAALWSAALTAATAEEFSTSGTPQWAAQAVHFNPGVARMILEHVFADTRDQPAASVNREDMLQAALVMAAVDPGRAVELLEAVPGPTKAEAMSRGYDASGEGFVDEMADSTRLQMIQVLALPAAKRASMIRNMLLGGDIDDVVE